VIQRVVRDLCPTLYILFACYGVADEFCVLSVACVSTRMRVTSPQN
jgi:hypothetical protein